MIFDINFPIFEFRFRIQILCSETIASIFKFIEIDLKVPKPSWQLIFTHQGKYGWIIHKHWKICELGKMVRGGCWKFVFLNKTYREYYGHYEQIKSEKTINS